MADKTIRPRAFFFLNISIINPHATFSYSKETFQTGSQLGNVVPGVPSVQG
jgi:hypothetical protein